MPVLVIDDGDLPALVALSTLPDDADPVVWHVAGDGPDRARRLDAVRDHAALVGERPPVVADALDPGAPGRELPPGLDEAHALVRALVAARQLGCGSVVWPVHLGPAFEAIGPALDRATAATALVHAGHDGPMLEVAMPLAELTDAQVVELADDAGAPLAAFWPCRGGGTSPCGTCAGCRPWLLSFEILGLPWPWAVSAPVA